MRTPPATSPPPAARAPCRSHDPLPRLESLLSVAVGAASTTRARCAAMTVPIAGRASATRDGVASTAHSLCAQEAALVMGGAPTRDASATRASRGATARSPHAPGTVQATARARRADVAAMRDGLTPTVGSLLTLFGHQPPRVSGCQRATSCAKRRARHQGRLRAMDETFCFSEARRGTKRERGCAYRKPPSSEMCYTHSAVGLKRLSKEIESASCVLGAGLVLRVTPLPAFFSGLGVRRVTYAVGAQRGAWRGRESVTLCCAPLRSG